MLCFVDTDDGLWRRVKENEDTPTGRYSHSGVIWNNSLLVFGGIGVAKDDTETESLDELYIHDCSTPPFFNALLSPLCLPGVPISSQHLRRTTAIRRSNKNGKAIWTPRCPE